MDTVTLVYTSNDERKTLTYELLTQYSATRKWLNMWVEFFETDESFQIRSENPTVTKGIEHYRECLYNLCYELVMKHDVPLLEGWDNKNYTQSFLNVLHDEFVDNNNIVTDNVEVHRLLKETNHAIHTLEGAMRVGNVKNLSYIKSVLREPWPETEVCRVEIEEEDQLNNVNWFYDEHCLFLAYGTLGKDLKMILDDGHLDLIKTGNVMPKTQISPWFSFVVPYRDGNLSETQRDSLDNAVLQSYYNSAIEQKSLLNEYGIDHTHWIHKPGRIVIAINKSGSKDDWNWFSDNEKITLSEISFDTSVVKTSFVLKDNNYK